MRASVPVASIRQAYRELRAREIKEGVGLQERLVRERVRDEFIEQIEYVSGIEIAKAGGKAL
jgi:hypothetical protein